MQKNKMDTTAASGSGGDGDNDEGDGEEGESPSPVRARSTSPRVEKPEDVEGFEELKGDPMLQVDSQQWLSRGCLFGAESRPGGMKTPPSSYKRKLKCQVDPKLFLLSHTGMQSMNKREAINVIQKKKIVHAVREAEHKKHYAEKVVDQAKYAFQEADEDGGGSLDVDELIEVVKAMREKQGNPIKSMDEKIKLHIEATDAVVKYGSLEYDLRGLELRAISFDGFLSMLGYEPWRTMFGIPHDISMFQARMTIMAKEVFEEADADGGGSLDAEELLGVVKSLREKMGKPITYEDGGREMRRMVREVDRAVTKYGEVGDDGSDSEEGPAIQFKDFLKMIKVEPWRTIFGVTEGLKKEKMQLAASKMAEDRRHTKAFVKRLNVLRGAIAAGSEGPRVAQAPYASDWNTLSQSGDKYRPSGGAQFGCGGHDAVGKVLASDVPRWKGKDCFFNSAGSTENSVSSSNYNVEGARPGIAIGVDRRLKHLHGEEYKTTLTAGKTSPLRKGEKKLFEPPVYPKEASKHPLCSRSAFSSNHLKISTRGGGGRQLNMFPPLPGPYVPKPLLDSMRAAFKNSYTI